MSLYINRSTLIFYLFIILSLFFIYKANNLQIQLSQTDDQSPQNNLNSKSYFNDIQYYLLKDLKPSLHLVADKLTMTNAQELIFFVKPVGHVFTSSGTKVNYVGNEGQLDQKENLLNLMGDVEIKGQDSVIDSNNAFYDIKNEYFEGKGDVKSRSVNQKNKDKIYVDAQLVKSWIREEKTQYIGNVRGQIKRNRPYEPSIYFRSQEAIALLPKSHIELLKDVHIKKGEITATSLRCEIFLDNYTKKLKYYVLYDDVKVVEKVIKNGDEDNFFTRRAYAEKLEGFMKDEKMILTGYPRVIQGEDVIKGNKITLVENNEVVEVDDSNSSFIIK